MRTAPRCTACRVLWRFGARATGLAILLGAALAVSAQDRAAAPSADPRFDGRTFSDVNLPATVQEHALGLRATRAWTWRDGNTERLLLDRDVHITIGPYNFRARRAAVWLEPIRINGRDAEQVALYFDEVSDPGGAVGFSQQGRRLLVTAIIAQAEHSLRADVRTAGRPDGELFVQEAEERLGRYLRELVVGATEGGAAARLGGPGGIAESALPDWARADDRENLLAAERSPVLLPQEGLVHLFADSIEVVDPAKLAPGDSMTPADPGERAMILGGGVVVQYTQLGSGYAPGHTVQISAQRAVVFLAEDADAGLTSYQNSQVRGIYLEGDVVATTGEYTLRGWRVYYDVQTDRAVVLDAVFWTYDEARGMPLYVRAESIRQESRSQWTARDVRLANVGFADPHFSIGATQVTVTRVPGSPAPPGRTPAGERTFVDAKGLTFRAGGVPLAYVPGMKGEVKPSVLKSITIGSDDGDPLIETSWDLYTLAGIDAKPGNQATLLLDGYFARGPAAGLDIDWRTSDLTGKAFAYYIHDDGTDRLPGGSREEHDSDDRGIVTAEQVAQLSDNWTLFLEGAWISDETFVPAFFRSQAETRREFINSAYLRYLGERSGFTVEGRATLNDFVANQYLIQSLGYTTQKFPEVAYHRVGDDIFNGLLSYSSDYTLSAMNLRFNEPTTREIGFRDVGDARAAFGLLPSQSIGDELRATGFSEDETYRADTRQDFEIPLRAGPVNIVPFVVGRGTVWSDDFEEFAGPDEEAQPHRLWGAAGIRFATTIQHVDDSLESRLLDLHRIRHLIEPSATLWHGASTKDQADLPIYDDAVESLATGSAARLGVRNTWQTQRGGEGRWRSVDWLVVDTNYTWSSDDADRESPYGRFIEAQPEQSNLGEFVDNQTVLYLTDALALTSAALYSVDNQTIARLTAGAIIDHGFGFSSFAEYRSLDEPRSTFVDVGARYEFTRKYAATIDAVVDARGGEFQEIGARIERRFPQWTVDLRLEIDRVTDDVSAGIILRPAGYSAERRTRIFTHDTDTAGSASAPTRERVNWGPFRD